MANHFLQTAQRLREISTAAHMSVGQRADLEVAVKIMCRLEQLKRDLIASASVLDDTGLDDSGGGGGADRVVTELMSLLGLHVGS
jgi:hypothetical protein